MHDNATHHPFLQRAAPGAPLTQTLKKGKTHSIAAESKLISTMTPRESLEGKKVNLAAEAEEVNWFSQKVALEGRVFRPEAKQVAALKI